MKHRLVFLDSWVNPPTLDFDFDSVRYVSTEPHELAERVKDATIVVISGTRFTRAAVESAPQLQLVACNGTGTDHVDKDALQEHGVALCHVPAQNTDSVTEHAFALYFSLRQRINKMHNVTISGNSWPTGNMLPTSFGPPPRTNSEETLVVVGYGALGRNVEKIGKALSMKVLIAERKGASVVREGRTSFEDAVAQGTVFILVTPIDASTRDMFGAAEFAKLQPTSLIVNVGRGGVINERDLADALRSGKIGGAATDVFEHEPATTETSPLLDPSIPNLVLSPHLAWYSSKTIQGTRATVKANLEGFANGTPRNILIPGRRSQF